MAEPASTEPGHSSPRVRRSPHEVERLILASARALFAQKGYAATTTREIAEHAGVHEPMVYRRFASKAKLFEAAVLVPFDEVISSYLDTREAQRDSPASTEELVRAFVDPLYTLLAEHGDLAKALIAAQSLPGELGDSDDQGMEQQILRLLDRTEPQNSREADRRGLRVSSPETVLTVVAMVLGMALLEQGLLASRPGWVTRDSLTEEMVNMILCGVSPPRETAPTSSGAEEPTGLILDLVSRLVAAERRAALAEAEAEAERARPPGRPAPWQARE